MMNRVLVCGTGRCGTASIMQALRDAGHDFTHQGIRHAHTLVEPPPEQPWVPFETGAIPGVDGDVSFEAVPRAGDLADLGWRVVLVVRDPIDMAFSWIRLGAFTDRMHETHADWWAAMSRWTPDVVDAWPVLSEWQRAVWWWRDWNWLAAEHAHVVIPFPQLSRRVLLHACGLGNLADVSVDDPMPHIDIGTPERHDVGPPDPVFAERARSWLSVDIRSYDLPDLRPRKPVV